MRVPLQLYSLEPPENFLVWNSARLTLSSVGPSLAQWQRVECLSMPTSTTDIPPGNISPSRANGINQTALCLSLGLSPSFAMKTNKDIEYYRLPREDLMENKRLLFTQAGYDPTTSVGLPTFSPVSRILMRQGRYWCMVMFMGMRCIQKRLIILSK